MLVGVPLPPARLLSSLEIALPVFCSKRISCGHRHQPHWAAWLSGPLRPATQPLWAGHGAADRGAGDAGAVSASWPRLVFRWVTKMAAQGESAASPKISTKMSAKSAIKRWCRKPGGSWTRGSKQNCSAGWRSSPAPRMPQTGVGFLPRRSAAHPASALRAVRPWLGGLLLNLARTPGAALRRDPPHEGRSRPLLEPLSSTSAGITQVCRWLRFLSLWLARDVWFWVAYAGVPRDDPGLGVLEVGGLSMGSG